MNVWGSILIFLAMPEGRIIPEKNLNKGICDDQIQKMKAVGKKEDLT